MLTMSKAKEITLLENPAYDVMEYNGYINFVIINNNTILISYNKEYFN